MFKNLTDNAKNLAANAKIEDMSKLFKNHMAGKPDVKNALSGVMVINYSYQFISHELSKIKLIGISYSIDLKDLEILKSQTGRDYVNSSRLPRILRKWKRIFRRSNAQFSTSLWIRSSSTSTPAVTA